MKVSDKKETRIDRWRLHKAPIKVAANGCPVGSGKCGQERVEVEDQPRMELRKETDVFGFGGQTQKIGSADSR